MYKEDITLANIADYLPLIDSIRYMCEFSGFDPNFDIVEEFKNPELPQDGVAEHNHVQGFRREGDKKPLVWTEWYEQFENETTIFLGALFVAKDEQGKGTGRTAYEQLESEWKQRGFTKVVLNVDLKNTVAILFWVSRGFKTIDFSFDTGVNGSGNYFMLRLSKLI